MSEIFFDESHLTDREAARIRGLLTKYASTPTVVNEILWLVGLLDHARYELEYEQSLEKIRPTTRPA